MSTLAIAATTGEGVSGLITVAAGNSIQVYATLDLGVGEAVTLERSYDSGVSWVPVIDERYRGTVLGDHCQSQVVAGPGDFRLRKTPTVNSIAIYYDS